MRSPEIFKRVIERKPLPVLGDGFVRVPYSTTEFDLRKEAEKHVAESGFTTRTEPLEQLHRHVKHEDQALTDGPLSKVSANVTEMVPGFGATYRALVKHIARNVLGFDVLFEKDPVIRFHFPVAMPNNYRAEDGTLLMHHTDTIWGDPFEMINCWVPLTRSFGTAALLLAPLSESVGLLTEFISELNYDEATYVKSRKRFFQKLCTDQKFQKTMVEACKPTEARYGEILMFDPRSFHGTDENKEDLTRVSFDFRLLPLTDYEVLERGRQETGTQAPDFGGVPFVRGGWFDSASAFEL
jgi:hypothetical protein